MNKRIQYFARKKGSTELPKPIEVKSQDSPSAPVEGLLKYVPSTFEYSSEFQFVRTPKVAKDARAAWYGYKRITPMKRTRKRQIERAKWMAIQHDHTCYEWSQWWHSKARKPKRWK